VLLDNKSDCALRATYDICRAMARQAKAQKSLYVPMIWGADILIDVCKEEVWIFGKLPMSEEDFDRRNDPHFGYLASVRTEFAQKRSPHVPPHIAFANATDAELILFIEQYGPFVASAVAEAEPPTSNDIPVEVKEGMDWRVSVCAIQELSVLKRERQIYAAVLRLLVELNRKETDCDLNLIRKEISAIADGISFWPEQCEKERRWNKLNRAGRIMWDFDCDKRDYVQNMNRVIVAAKDRDQAAHIPFFGDVRGIAHLVLCELINSFRTEVQLWGERRVEVVPLASLVFGIRPVLYLILKRAYLGRGGVELCANDRCGRLFEVQRAGQRYCNPDCSQKSRQRVYWRESGSQKRRRRRKQKTKAARSVRRVRK